jgi:stress-induced morphogen
MPETTFDYPTESERVKQALKSYFRDDAYIVTDEGYNGRVHVRIVSKQFDGKREEEKQALIWEILREKLGPEAASVSLVIPYGMDEL